MEKYKKTTNTCTYVDQSDIPNWSKVQLVLAGPLLKSHPGSGEVTCIGPSLHKTVFLIVF